MSNAPKKIKKVGDALWEIPTSYKDGMQVPARIVATPKLLQTMDASVFDQITNVACLPGLLKSVYCMPDGHSGYGAPIGAVAAFDAETGMVSPGICGFDINCLTPESEVLCKYGYSRKIGELQNVWNNEEFAFSSIKNKTLGDAKLMAFMRRVEEEKVYRIKTKAEHTIEATGDHPIFTTNGFINASKLKKEDKVIAYPFKGVPYE